MTTTLTRRRPVPTTVALLVWLGGYAAARADAQESASVQAKAPLARHAAELGASDPELRARAFGLLSQLADESLPWVEQRLSAVLTVRPTHDDALRVLTALRHATGSRREGGVVDLAHGVLPLLEKERSPAVLAMVEPLLYLRAIERATTTELQLGLARFVGLDQGAWDSELGALRARHGLRLLPAWIRLRSHASPAVRRFAQASVAQLEMDDPARALATSDAHLLSRLVHAYADPPDYAAMPLIARMVGERRIEVRAAARAALSRFGKNAIWQVRELYEEVSGQPADKSLGFQSSADELYAVLDRAELEETATLLARGERSLLRDDLPAMQRDYDTLLAKYPDFADRAKLAPGYAALGAARHAEEDLEGALAGYRRAVRLDPRSKDLARWRAQIAYLSAELLLGQGVVDLAGYERALALDPTLTPAADAKDLLSGETARRKVARKRWAAGGAMLLLALAALALRRTAQRPRPAEPDAAA